jgi:hypothetical protein
VGSSLLGKIILGLLQTMMDNLQNESTLSINYVLKEPKQPGSVRLTGFGAFFLTETTSSEHSTRQALSPLRPGLFGIKQSKKKLSSVDLDAKSEFIVLIPRREVTQRTRSQKGITAQISERRYVLITFHPFKDATLRQKANRLVWKTPLIRIRPGLMVSPHIRISRFRRYEGILLRPSKYVQQVVELGKTVWYAPKLQLLNSNQERTFEILIQNMFEERAEFISRSCNKLLKDAKEFSNQPGWIRSAGHQLNLLRNLLRLIRAKSAFFQREFGFDYHPIITRAATRVSRVRQKVLNP